MGKRSTLKKLRQDLFCGVSVVCYLCNQKITCNRDLTLDHVLPRCLGGKSSRHNLKPAHLVCNRKKGAMTIEEYRKTQDY